MKGISACIILFACSGIFAQEDHPILGTWTLNAEASDTRMNPPRMDVRQYSLRDDGLILGLAVWVNADGSPDFLQFTGRTDGQRYPEYDSPLLAELQATGTLSSREFTETIIDNNTTEWANLSDGEVLGSGTRVYSENGSRMTININITNEKGNPDTFSLVYDKQEKP